MKLADRLKAARKHAGLTQKALAERAGVEQPLISQIERGVNLKSAHTARLARACGVDPYWLETGNGVAPTTVSQDYRSPADQLDDLPVRFSIADSGRVAPVDGPARAPSSLANLYSQDKRAKLMKLQALAAGLDDDEIEMLCSILAGMNESQLKLLFGIAEVIRKG